MTNPAAIEELKKQVRGEVLQPSDAGYGEGAQHLQRDD